MIRLFFALNLPPESRDRIAAGSEALREAAPSIAWVRTPLLHLTLKFLGAQQEEMVGHLADLAARVAADAGPLRFTLARYGAFPNLQRPRVVWLGITQGADAIGEVAAALDQGCGELGIARESRPFKAHLTLGRVKKELSNAERLSLATAAARASREESVVVSCIDLMRSDQGPSGSRYTVVASAALGGA